MLTTSTSRAPSTLEPPHPWLADAVCAQTDPEAFHPVPGGSPQQAKKVCFGCPVKAACLAYALEHSERGIWGGTTDGERRYIRRRAAAAAAGEESVPQLAQPRRTRTPGGMRAAVCGTFPGYRKHKRDNTTPCLGCRDAAQAHWTQERIRREKRSETTSS